jgi:hypothetical protein
LQAGCRRKRWFWDLMLMDMLLGKVFCKADLGGGFCRYKDVFLEIFKRFGENIYFRDTGNVYHEGIKTPYGCQYNIDDIIGV